MFGGIEDGAKLIPEPLLDEDITCNALEKYALLRVKFATRPAPSQRRKVPATNEFDGLESAMLQVVNGQTEEEARALENSSLQAKKKVIKTLHKEVGVRPAKGSVTALFQTFVKATNYARDEGASLIHPRAKIDLFGLLMQAKEGDCPAAQKLRIASQGTKATLVGSLSTRRGQNSSLALQSLKLKAWGAQRGKSREDAMKEYVALVTQLAPQWKVANILKGSLQGDRKKIKM